MARSMTAYGRSHIKTEVGNFLIEIHSVNRKSLDIHSNLPKDLLLLDMDLRKRLASEVKRGNVSIRITKDTSSPAGMEVPSLELMKKMRDDWALRAKQLAYDSKDALPFTSLMQFASISAAPPLKIDNAFKSSLLKGFDEAMRAFITMKETEGKALKEDILPRLKEISANVMRVEKLAENAPKRFHERLTKRLQEIQVDHQGDEDRIARELVIFADRIDVTEEITRLTSHLVQFGAILSEDKRRVGRELDFLTQEMNRETNTIASKSQELEITQVTLEVKSELEKIREQLQNIE